MPEAAGTNGGVKRIAIRLAPMRVPKASDVLADELRERIFRGDFAEGIALPAERDLVEQTGLSRATVREALRILEAQSLVRVKAGRAGGAIVKQPGKESLASTVTMLIRGRDIRMSTLLETREAIEPACAELAARHRTTQDLNALETANAILSAENVGLETFLKANIDWHLGVAAATHNELLTGVMLALSRAIYASTENEQAVDVPVRRETAKAHRAVTDAIRAQDEAAALRRMTRHVAAATAVLSFETDTVVPFLEPAHSAPNQWSNDKMHP